jgi:hypothetical protein
MTQLVKFVGADQNLRRGGVLVGWLGDAPATAAPTTPTTPTSPATAPTVTPAAASAPAAAASPATTGPSTQPAPTKDKSGLMATFEALPTVAKVGIGAGVAAVVVGTVAAIVAASK